MPDDRATFEVQVGSRIGALLTAALGPAEVSRSGSRIHLTITTAEPWPVSDLARRLHDLGVEVDEIRMTRRTCETAPDPR